MMTTPDKLRADAAKLDVFLEMFESTYFYFLDMAEGEAEKWCSEAEVVEERRCADWGHEQIARGGALVLHDVEDIDEKWELDLEKFLNGFKLWVEQGLDEYGAVQKDGTVDCCQIDAACADEIVQLALFGEVTFG